jgi:hypothetical protein
LYIFGATFKCRNCRMPKCQNVLKMSNSFDSSWQPGLGFHFRW